MTYSYIEIELLILENKKQRKQLKSLRLKNKELRKQLSICGVVSTSYKLEINKKIEQLQNDISYLANENKKNIDSYQIQINTDLIHIKTQCLSQINSILENIQE